jgi:putative NADPH-quinone reductase
MSDARRALVVYCHPDPASFTAAVKDTAVAALQRAGHEVHVRDLYGDGFDPLFSAEERRAHQEPGPRPNVVDHATELGWCEHLVLIYPTWWSGQPAMLKGWIDRVWVRGIAWELPAGGNRVRPRLKNVRRITAITTHGSGRFINRLEGEAGKHTITRSLRFLCHRFARTRWVAMYGLDTATAAERERFLARVSKRLR